MKFNFLLPPSSLSLPPSLPLSLSSSYHWSSRQGGRRETTGN